MDLSNRPIVGMKLKRAKVPIYTPEFSCFFGGPPFNNDFALRTEFHGIVTLGMEDS
jgi:hypothetical protein